MPLPEHCQEHGEAIATILANTTAMEAHLRTLNGRVGRAENQIATLSVKQGAHDVIQATIMQKLMPLEESMGKMKDWRSSVIGGTEGKGKLIRDWAMLIGLALSIWMGWMQRESLSGQLRQVQATQHETK